MTSFLKSLIFCSWDYFNVCIFLIMIKKHFSINLNSIINLSLPFPAMISLLVFLSLSLSFFLSFNEFHTGCKMACDFLSSKMDEEEDKEDLLVSLQSLQSFMSGKEINLIYYCCGIIYIRPLVDLLFDP